MTRRRPHSSRYRRARRAALTVAVELAAAVAPTAPSPSFGQAAPTAPPTTPPAGAATRPAALPPLVVPGTVAAFYSTDLYAMASGYVAAVKADIGDHVAKGDVLAEIDAPELRQQLAGAEATRAAKGAAAKASEAALRQARAALDVARAQLAGYEADRALAEANLKRQEALFAGKAATGQQMDEMRAKAEGASAADRVGRAKIAAAEADVAAAEATSAVAAAQVTVAAADVERVQVLLAYTRVVAPFDGVVTRRSASPGDLVQASAGARGSPLFTCQKLDVVRVACEVPESAAAGVRPGVRADVRLYGPAGAAAVPGTVTRVATSIDPATRTMRAEVDLPNPAEALRPGMYAQVTLVPEPSGGAAGDAAK